MTPTRRSLPLPPTLLAWAIASLAVVLSAAALVLGGEGTSPKLLVLPTLWAVPGALIAAARPRIAVGWLVLGVGLLFAVAGFGDRWARTDADGSQTGVGWAIWATDRLSVLLAVCTWLALVLLPDGRLPSRRWRPVVAAVLLVQGAVLTVFVFARGPAAGPDSDLPGRLSSVPNPVGVFPAGLAGAIEGLDFVVLQVPLLLCLVAIAVRLRKAELEERTRIAGLLLSAVCLVLIVVLGHAVWPAAAGLLDVLAGGLFALALTAAILRRRLHDVEVVVRPAVVYTVLTALIATIYVGVAAVVARPGRELPPFGAGVVAAAVALAVQPLRAQLQQLVDRLLYGDVRDPYRALQRLADRTHHAPTVQVVLEQLAATTAASLRAPWAQATAGGQTAQSGIRPAGSQELVVELMSGETSLGALSAAAAPGRRLGPGEQRLLSALGRHGGVAVSAVLLSEDLKASRQRLVTTREQERQRLRRDLHDELGPTLAGLTMQLGTVHRLVRTEPHAAEERVMRLQDFSRAALETVRRLAQGLRPPALDELGLAESLRRLAESLDLELTGPPAALPPLPAAVEVAAYRIVAEGLSNIARHAGTGGAELAFVVDEHTLVLCLSDQGRGCVPGAPGVGLIAMRERAEELGGSLAMSSAPGGGTRVTAWLPLRLAAVGFAP
jgi:signal transduction histidine kinase